MLKWALGTHLISLKHGPFLLSRNHSWHFLKDIFKKKNYRFNSSVRRVFSFIKEIFKGNRNEEFLYENNGKWFIKNLFERVTDLRMI